MVPVYNCNHMLAEALGGVLAHDPGPHRMQIAIVDDCSPNGDARAVAESLAPGRIEYHRNERNLGIGGNWNACLRHSRGRWVHLLHQDDHVRDGFYTRLTEGIEREPSVGCAMTRFIYMDADGHWTGLGPILRRDAGVLGQWLETICSAQVVQCPSVAVKRETYERLGGFREDLDYLLDLEMWVRIAIHDAVWYDPEPLAIFRTHDANQSSRLWRTGSNIDDVYRCIEVLRPQLPADRRDELIGLMRAFWREHAMDLATDALVRRDRTTALAQLDAIAHYEPRLWLSARHWACRWWATKIRLRDALNHLRSRPESPVTPEVPSEERR